MGSSCENLRSKNLIFTKKQILKYTILNNQTRNEEHMIENSTANKNPTTKKWIRIIDVSELEAFVFCKKKWYIRTILGIQNKFDLMDLGTYLHELQDTPFSKKELFIANEDIGLKGRIDYYIQEKDIPHIPVEIKKSIGTMGIYPSHKIQLAAYALLLMRNFGHPVPYGYLLYKEQKKKIKITMTQELIKKTIEYANEINFIVEKWVSKDLQDPKVQTFLETIKTTQRTKKCAQCSLEDFCMG